MDIMRGSDTLRGVDLTLDEIKHRETLWGSAEEIRTAVLTRCSSETLLANVMVEVTTDPGVSGASCRFELDGEVLGSGLVLRERGDEQQRGIELLVVTRSSWPPRDARDHDAGGRPEVPVPASHVSYKGRCVSIGPEGR
jgi:hypothetical protein